MPETIDQYSIPVAFRAFILSVDPVGELDRDAARAEIQDIIEDRIHYQHVPEFSPEECEKGILPYVWYRQSGTLRDRCLDSYDPKPHVITIDVEVWGETPGLGEIIENDFAILFEGFSGTMANITMADALIENQDDNYVPQGISADYGLHGQAFQIEFYPDWS